MILLWEGMGNLFLGVFLFFSNFGFFWGFCDFFGKIQDKPTGKADFSGGWKALLKRG